MTPVQRIGRFEELARRVHELRRMSGRGRGGPPWEALSFEEKLPLIATVKRCHEQYGYATAREVTIEQPRQP